MESPSTTWVHGFDRLHLWFDRTQLLLPLRNLDRHCASVKKTVGEMTMNPRFKMKIDVLQPTRGFLDGLSEAIGREINVLISYVEIAADLIVESESEAAAAEEKFLSAAVIPHQHQKVQRFENTFYFRRRATSGSKRGKVFALYADKPSKLPSQFQNAPALHLECRIQGSAELGKLGILTVSDLAQFDHRKFWKESVRMYELPAATQLGEILRGRNNVNVSGQALRARAKRFRQYNRLGDRFILQNAAKAEPRVLRSLRFYDLFKWSPRN